jgi:putative DNA primase/helicase
VSDWKTAANGRWLEILTGLGGISEDFLQNRHGPCPLCGGTKRFRWDDRNGDGVGYCNDCGGRNGAGGQLSGIDLLSKSRGWTFVEGVRNLEDYLGIKSSSKHAKKPHRIPEKPPVDAPAPDLRGAAMQWCYRNSEGEQLFWIQRVNTRNGKKLFVYRTWIDGGWHRPSRNDDFTCEWPAPRPLYGLERLAAAPEATVLLAEGEKSADAANALSGHVGVSWPNGSKSIRKVDFSALAGRRVAILRDNDDDGITCTKGLIELLTGVAASVAVIDPPDGAPPKWDIADPFPDGADQLENWLTRGADAEAWMSSGPSRPPDPPEVVVSALPLDQIPITCLGFSGDDYFYQSHDSGQVTRISKAAHSSSTSLIGLADLSVWEQAYPRYNGEGEIIGVSWKTAVNDLFRKQHRVGVFDPSRIRGVGAWIDNSRHVFHLGDRLLVDGVEHSVFDPPASRYLYQRHSRRIGPGDSAPLTTAQGMGIIAMAERFHWEEPISGTLLAGWIALAPICGALDWRPHVWLQAVAGSGKTTVLNRFVSPLLSDLRLNVMGCTTEAGIRQRLKSDAIPVVFDESESNQKRDAERIQSVLALARIASSESDSVALKGSAGGDSIQFQIRSMFLLSSIATALRQGADESRFCVLTLRIPDQLSKEDRDQQWRQLDADLIGAITPECGRRLAARMIRMVPVVRAATRTFAKAAALELGGSRAGDQVGALLAGAWALWNDEPPTDEQAVDLIRSSDWNERKQQAMEAGGDQRTCLDLILQARLNVEGEHRVVSRTVWELIEVVSGLANPLVEVSTKDATEELGRNGIKVEGDQILISNTAKGIQTMLKETPWSEKGWANMLSSLPGATKGKLVRFKGLAQPTRCVQIPKSLAAPEESAD